MLKDEEVLFTTRGVFDECVSTSCRVNTYHRVNGKLHREDGPSFEHANGDKSWYLNDKLHRADGPAVEYINGTKAWWFNNKRHREDGPAVEYHDGAEEWYLNHKFYGEKKPENWKELVRLYLVESIMKS